MGEGILFNDRVDAGRQLAGRLEKHRASNPLILALPRGGVVVGAEIARALGCDLDVMLVKKLRAPGNPELAIGAISEEGRVHLNEEVARLSGADAAYIERERTTRMAEMAEQKMLYRAVRSRIDPIGRAAILADDGLATGASMIAAIQAAAQGRPAKLMVAVPVSPPETLETIGAMDEVDEVVCLAAPDGFAGVGQFYQEFDQVPDEDVVAILRQFAGK